MSLDIAKTNLVLVSRKGGVAVAELNRPKKRNALSQELIDELTGVLRQLDQDSEVRVVVLTSSGGAPFCGMSLDSIELPDFGGIMTNCGFSWS
jgi:enoyl-CoA hydratase